MAFEGPPDHADPPQLGMENINRQPRDLAVQYKLAQIKIFSLERELAETRDRLVRSEQIRRRWKAWAKKHKAEIYQWPDAQPIPEEHQGHTIDPAAPSDGDAVESAGFAGLAGLAGGAGDARDGVGAHNADHAFTVGHAGDAEGAGDAVGHGDAGNAVVSTEERIISSQATEDDEDEDLTVMDQHPSSDDVEVVSARPVKRRRHEVLAKTSSTRIKQEPNSPDNPIELGSNDYSSPPVMRKRPLRRETSDLDSLSIPHIMTPRKRRREDRANSVDVQPPPKLIKNASSLSEGNAPTARPPHPGITTCVKGESTAKHLQVNQSAKQRTPQNQPDALRKLDVNSLSTSKMPRNSASAKKIRRYDGRKSDVAMLAEDGDMESSQVVVTTPQFEPKIKTERDLRLISLLENPTPGRAPIPQRQTPVKVNNTTRRPAKHADPTAGAMMTPVSSTSTSALRREEPSGVRNQIPTSNTKRATAQSARPASTKFTSRLEKSPPLLRPEDEPLRSRPLDKLGLDDFRINPAYMGSKFAFADTLRGRDHRRNLHHYTRADAPGDSLRRAVEFGALPNTKPDSQLLEAYLGPDWDEIMHTFSPAKQHELLLQARTHAFANQHGKHRQAFQRAKSPPGFWRTDMPSTQEEAQDRLEAEAMEREKVEERWREALRPGGRWLFRDEKV